jgi:hypothetical protein
MNLILKSCLNEELSILETKKISELNKNINKKFMNPIQQNCPIIQHMIIEEQYRKSALELLQFVHPLTSL